MSKRLVCLLLALALMTPAAALEPAPVLDAILGPPPLEPAVTLNGVPLALRSVPVDGEAWLPVAETVAALLPEAAAEWEDGALAVTGEGVTLTARADDPYLVVNGRYLYIPAGISRTGDTLLAPADVLARALGLTLEEGAAPVTLAGDVSPLESGDSFYNAADLDLIARVVYHESGNQRLEGRIAVANVILNRVAAGSKAGFKDTVYDVIYQKNQFPGAASKAPDDGSVIAAKLALDGAMVVPGAFWFNRAGLKNTWAARNKRLLYTLQDHDFYG